MLSAKVLESITYATGLSPEAMRKMDTYHEFAYIEKKNGKKLSFSKTRDARKMGRGSPLISRHRFNTMEDVDKRIDKLK